MSQQSLLDFLLEDGPGVEDTLLASFLEEDVPDALAEKTLNRVALLRTQPEEAPQDLSKWKTHRTWAKASVFLAMAAAVLLAVFPPSSGELQGDFDHMTAKGEQDGAPTVTLKIAAIQNGVASRHALMRPTHPRTKSPSEYNRTKTDLFTSFMSWTKTSMSCWKPPWSQEKVI
jgi:negative regulator of sigma E activity